MLRISIIEDEIGDLVAVIRNLMALDRREYQFEILPVLLSDPEVDTNGSVEAWAEKERNKLRQKGYDVGHWPQIHQKGLLQPVLESDRKKILDFLVSQRVDTIISDSWIGKELAGVMLLDAALKEEYWSGDWRCWMMTKNQKDVLEKMFKVGGWRAEKFKPYEKFIHKDLIINAKPGSCDSQLIRMISESIVHANLRVPRELPQDVEEQGKFGSLIGNSDVMRLVYKKILAVADHNVDVLILGETGTGKNLVAQEIHNHSRRRNQPFKGYNCAKGTAELIDSELFGYAPKSGIAGANPDGKPGLFELANHGTLFLNEIGDMPLTVQTKILDVFDGGEITREQGTKSISVDIRIISGTDQPLDEMIEDGRFREQLYARVSGFRITMPPLRDRRDDIPLLCKHFIEKYSREGEKKDTSSEAQDILQQYSWPRNVRQLEKTIQVALINASGMDLITPQHLEIDGINIEQKIRSESRIVTFNGPAQSWENMTASEIHAAIEAGEVVKNLPEWDTEIGKPKTFAIINLVERKRGGHHPKPAEIEKMFGMTAVAWRGWIHRNKAFRVKQETD
jgi:transcriptional regulator with PAS, ATPase and Fis domain